MQQQLLPLDQSSRYRGHAAALAAKNAEDVDVTYLESLIEEAKQIFPECEVLWLYFRSQSGNRSLAWTPVQTLMLDSKWRSCANAGVYDGGAHGLLIFVGVHTRYFFIKEAA